MKTDPQIFSQAAKFVKCLKRGARVRVPAMVFRLWPQFKRTVHQLMEEND